MVEYKHKPEITVKIEALIKLGLTRRYAYEKIFVFGRSTFLRRLQTNEYTQNDIKAANAYFKKLGRVLGENVPTPFLLYNVNKLGFEYLGISKGMGISYPTLRWHVQRISNTNLTAETKKYKDALLKSIK